MSTRRQPHQTTSGAAGARHRRDVGHRPRGRAAAGPRRGRGPGSRPRRRARRRDGQGDHRRRRQGRASSPPTSATPPTCSAWRATSATSTSWSTTPGSRSSARPQSSTSPRSTRCSPATSARRSSSSRALAPGMAARGRGSIVSVSSMAGGVGLVGGAAYGATKASLEAMTRAWAAEYSASGVRVNAIAPGPVYTPSPSGPEFITALGETTPMHRASQPEEIAEVVAFLASPRASYITGTTVAADGGRTSDLEEPVMSSQASDPALSLVLDTSGRAHNTAPTQFVEVGETRFAYRRFGFPLGTPIVLLQHFMGNLDNYDPAITDAPRHGPRGDPHRQRRRRTQHRSAESPEWRATPPRSSTPSASSRSICSASPWADMSPSRSPSTAPSSCDA